jgi:hypothetical protein
VGDVPLVLACDQRKGNTLCADRRIAAAGRKEYLAQRLLRAGVVSGELSSSRTQEGGLGQQRVGAHVHRRGTCRL